MNIDSIAAPVTHRGEPSRRSPRWAWLALPLFVLLMLMALALSQSFEPSSFVFRIGDDDGWVFSDDGEHFSGFGALVALFVAALVLAIVLPVTLAIVLGAGLLALLLGVGLPVLLVIATLGVLLSPLLLLGWLLWKLLT